MRNEKENSQKKEGLIMEEKKKHIIQMISQCHDYRLLVLVHEYIKHYLSCYKV